MCTVKKPPSSLKHKSAASQEAILGHCTFSLCWQWLPYIPSQMCSRCHRFLNELCKSTSRLGSTEESLFYLFQQRDKQICCYLLPQHVTFCQTWSKLKAAEAESTTNVTVHSPLFLNTPAVLPQKQQCLPCLPSHPFLSKLKWSSMKSRELDWLQGRKVGDEEGGGFGRGSYSKLIWTAVFGSLR